MEHIDRRCKHCNKEYVYCTYGNGPGWGTEKGCSIEFGSLNFLLYLCIVIKKQDLISQN